MKKNILIFPFLLLSAFQIYAQDSTEVDIPDLIFKGQLLKKYDDNKDGKIQYSEVEKVKILRVDFYEDTSEDEKISDLTGIEAFVKLEKLYCYYNKLTKINLRHNKNLVYVNFSNCKVSNIDLTQNKELKSLYCSNNKLVNLDLSENSKLEEVECNGNELVGIKFAENNKLESLWCNGNKLANLELEKNIELKVLKCNGNKLKVLDVTHNTNLNNLECNSNKLAELDVRKNPKLKYFHCKSNQLKEIDVTQNFKLKYLCCDSNQLKKINVSQNLALYKLTCVENNLTEIDVRKNTALHSLFCSNNQLKKIDVTQNTKLKYLYCDYTNLSELNLTQNVKLYKLSCHHNNLSNLVLSKNTELKYFYCNNNKIKSLDLSSNVKLTKIILFDNPDLEYLNIANGKNSRLTFQALNCPKLKCIQTDTGVDPGGVDTGKDPGASYSKLCERHLIKEIIVKGENNVSSIDEDNGTLQMLADILPNNASNNSLKWSVEKGTGLATIDEDSGTLTAVSDGTVIVKATSKDGTGVSGTKEINISNQKHKLTLNYDATFATVTLTPKSTDGLYKQGETVTVKLVLKKPYFEFISWSGASTSVNKEITVQIDSEKTLTANFKDAVVYIPDENFKKKLVANFDRNNDKEIQYSEAELVDDIDVSNYKEDNKISDLTGIEAFINLKKLYCQFNELTELSLKGNVKLELLACGRNKLTKLDVVKNTMLEILYCQQNKLEDIDLSNNTSLESLNLDNNELKKLDLAKNTNLSYLDCNYNEIQVLDLGENTKLLSVNCSYNQMQSLDLGENTKLSSVNCSYNQIQSLDLTKNIKVTVINCQHNKLQAFDASVFTDLEELYCNDNELVSLNIANKSNTTINVMHAHNNKKLMCIKADKNRRPYQNDWKKDDTASYNEDCVFDLITEIKVKGENNNSTIDIDNGTLQMLATILPTDASVKDLKWSVENGTGTATIDEDTGVLTAVYNGKVTVRATSIDGSSVFGTKDINISNQVGEKHKLIVNFDRNIGAVEFTPKSTNGIFLKGTTVTVKIITNNKHYEFVSWSGASTSENKEITVQIDSEKTLDAHFKEKCVYIPDNNLKEKLLQFDDNNDKEIQYSEAMAVSEIDVTFDKSLSDDKKISNLTGIEAFVNIESLRCSYNKINTIALTKNTKLKFLACSSNEITQIDVSENVELETLYCANNQITNLDLIKNLKLNLLECKNNKIISLNTSKNLMLRDLNCKDNSLKDLKINGGLVYLNCSNNQLSALDVTKSSQLKQIGCKNNNLKDLDLVNNLLLNILDCSNNKIHSLDLSAMDDLTVVYCNDNQLINLNIANGNNDYIEKMYSQNNTDLTCIKTDKSSKPKSQDWKKDDNASYNKNCVIALDVSLTGEIVKVYDGTTNATLTSSNYVLKGVQAKDVVSITNTSGVYDTEEVGKGKMVTVSNLTLSGKDATKYILTSTSVKAAIGEITKVFVDSDGDGISDENDNCPSTVNADQNDLDGDGKGDVCDDDIDGDGVPNSEDCNPTDPNINSKTIYYIGIDADKDGFIGSVEEQESCSKPQGYELIKPEITDCDDNNELINPNSVDENCEKIKLSKGIHVPAGFTPDGDTINDFWVITKGEGVKLSVELYDIGGRLVYNNSNYTNDFDGISDGIKLANASYFYIISYKENNEEKVVKGWVYIKH